MSVSSAGEKDTPPGKHFSGVDFRDGLLRVSVENQKFHRVMDEVARETGVKIVINDTTDKDLTIDFDYLPLEKGLKRLLRGRNYVFIYRSGQSVDSIQSSERLAKVLVLPKSGGWTMAGLGEMAENRSADRTKQTGAFKEVLKVQETLEKALKGFSQSEIDVREQFNEAVKNLTEMTRFEDDVFQGFPQGGVDLSNPFIKAVERMREREGLEGENFSEGRGELIKEIDQAPEGIKDADKVLKMFMQNQNEIRPEEK